MIARTAVAKAFRVWVLDIIDHHLGRRTVEPTPEFTLGSDAPSR